MWGVLRVPRPRGDLTPPYPSIARMLGLRFTREMQEFREEENDFKRTSG